MERIVRPFQDFAHKQSSGGILLIAAAAIALALHPWSVLYLREPRKLYAPGCVESGLSGVRRGGRGAF